MIKLRLLFLAGLLVSLPLHGESDAERDEKSGTIRKYIKYVTGVVLPQILAKYGFVSPGGANLCSVGTGMYAIGEACEFESIQTLGEQAFWGSIANELLRWEPLSNTSQNSLNAVHGFIGKFSGSQVDAVSAEKLNHTIATVGLGNLLRKLYEYW